MMCFVMLNEVCDEIIENLMGDSNSDDGVLALLAQNQRKKRVRIENYVECTVPQYSLQTFRSHFRTSKRTVVFLEGFLAVVPALPHPPKQGGRAPIPLRKQILLTL